MLGPVSPCNVALVSVDTVEVWGSSPHGPTIQNKDLARIPKKHSGVQKEPDLLITCRCMFIARVTRFPGRMNVTHPPPN
jgi:hypothetical protein